jgi:hypothetical protein
MYAKLFSRISESSLMEEPIATRYAFMMLLAICDPQGYVIGTDVAIARRLNIPLADFQEAIAHLSAPDPNSNSKEADGRRVLPSEGERGYRIVNFLKYRNVRDEEERREYMRGYIADYRAAGKDKSRPGKHSVNPVNSVNFCKPRLAQADAYADAEAEAEQNTSKKRTVVESNGPPAPDVLPDEALFWNSHENLPKVQKLTDKRKKALHVRRSDPFFVTNCASAIDRIAKSDFCLGKGKSSTGWKADFDFLLQPDTVVKVMEGKYDTKLKQDKPF